MTAPVKRRYDATRRQEQARENQRRIIDAATTLFADRGYAGTPLTEIAARHADPRTTMRYDRARQNLDRHPNYILAAYMASGT